MLLAALTVFFASGFAALLYQVVWQRMLTIFSGADVHSATIVVAAFMAGLGCGSFAGGQIADRVSRRASLALFMVAELAVGAFGFVSSSFFYGFLYQHIGPLGLGVASTSGILFISLLWPTFFMGVSLPLLARALTRDVNRAASTVGWLYACNTLGAAAGALGGTWWFLPRAGLDGSVKIAAIINVACAVVALVLAATSRSLRAGSPFEIFADTATVATSTQTPTGGPTFSNYAQLFAMSGFLALSLEIVWFRLLGVMLKSTALTFGTLLAIYLLGLGAGAAMGSAAAARIRRPAALFVGLQIGASVYAALSVAILIARLQEWRPLLWLPLLYSSSESVNVGGAVLQMQAAIAGWFAATTPNASWPWAFTRLYMLVPGVLILPPTVMMGGSFPLLQKLAQTDLRYIGRRVGILLAANIVGSTLGAFVTGWVLLDRLGTAGTLRLLVGVSGVFAVLGLRWWGPTRRPIRLSAYAAIAVLIAGTAGAVPGAQRLWAALHGAHSADVIMVEDGSGLALLKIESRVRTETGDFPRVVVFVNGLGQSWLPYGGIHTVLGALPAFFHPNPREAAIIGLGSGDTLFAMAGRKELERITSIEIIRPQLAALGELSRRYNYPGLLPVLDRSRIQHEFGDARLFLSRSRRTFDIIEADALYPTAAYAGNLYSDAYFELLRDHLNPGGLAVSWSPTERVARTFVKVFPHAWRSGQVILGSNDPIQMDRDAIMQRLTESASDNYYRWAGVDLARLLRPYIQGPWRRYGPDNDRAALVDINTDLYPKDELGVSTP
jgi:predicted membrane-bound spermidine synthase